MADTKKPDKKESKPAPKKDPFIEIVSLLAVIFIGLYILNGLIGAFTSTGLFSRGWKGLTPHGIILAHTRPINSLNNPIGTKVVSTSDDTDVYNSPDGEKKGTQPFGSKGKILQGYVEINEQRYWYVDYEQGVDGWVKEGDIGYVESGLTVAEKIILWFWSAITYLKIFSVILSLVFISIIAYVVIKLTAIRKNQYALIYPNLEVDHIDVNPKWQKILTHIESLNENDWKLAIIEADIMLDDILNKLSLPGDTMGDKMKAVEKSDFNTIDLAWEAHKIRNQIAHEGSDFTLTQHEVRRVIGLYESIFKEFQVI